MKQYIRIIKGKEYGKGITFKAYLASALPKRCSAPRPQNYRTERAYLEAYDKYCNILLGNF